jgi:uncharacterized LabA/DUF88 family protein
MGTAWIIDAGYAHSLQRSAGRDFDYVKFKKKLCELAGETIRETYYLTTIPDSPDPDLDAFHNWLQQAEPHGPKMRVQIYRLKNMNCKCPHCGQEFRRLVQRGVDVGIATMILKLSAHYDRIILLAGDGDFADAIEFIKDQRKEFWLIGQHGTVAAELQSYADHMLWLDDALWKAVEKSRPPARRAAPATPPPAAPPKPAAVRPPESPQPAPSPRQPAPSPRPAPVQRQPVQSPRPAPVQRQPPQLPPPQRQPAPAQRPAPPPQRQPGPASRPAAPAPHRPPQSSPPVTLSRPQGLPPPPGGPVRQPPPPRRRPPAGNRG